MKTVLIFIWAWTLVILIGFAAMCFVMFVPKEWPWRDPALYATGGLIGLLMSWRLIKIIYRDAS